jgi:23S rRNA-/tRNA-specific pseudouridylate synthase
MCLHATRLAFVHPATGARVAFESAAPGDWV